MRLHRRQFLIGKESSDFPDEWPRCALDDHYVLAYDPALPVKSVEDRNGRRWCLLGVVAQNDPNKNAPEEEIASAEEMVMERICRTWAGRWILVGGGAVYTDASALLGCFYAKDSKTGGVLISSSPALLLERVGPVGEENAYPDLSPDSMLGWYPPPHSKYPMIRRLLPSQKLTFTTGEITARPLVDDTLTECSEGEALNRLERDLITAVRNASVSRKRVWLPLTAGYDSRLLLAMALRAGVRPVAVTQVGSETVASDVTIARELARVVGIEHRVVSPGQMSYESLGLYDRHTAGHHTEVNREFFACGQLDWAAEDDLILCGACFEFGRCYYWSLFPEKMVDVAILLEMMSEAGSPLGAALNEWGEWVVKTPDALDWRDRFYLEQRLAGWSSSIEQSVDLTPGDGFFAINSRASFSSLMALSSETRKRASHHVELIRRMDERLLKLPFNPKASLYERFCRKVRKKFDLRGRRF